MYWGRDDLSYRVQRIEKYHHQSSFLLPFHASECKRMMTKDIRSLCFAIRILRRWHRKMALATKCPLSWFTEVIVKKEVKYIVVGRIGFIILFGRQDWRDTFRGFQKCTPSASWDKKAFWACRFEEEGCLLDRCTIVYWMGRREMDGARYRCTQARHEHETPSFYVDALFNRCLIENTHCVESFNGINPLQGEWDWDRRAIAINW